jgi:hypothetical protein
MTPLALGLAGCELVAGTGTRTLNPEVTGDGLPGTVDGGGMPSLGNGRIRIANLAVTPGNVDFCVKLSSASSWGEPIMANSGKDAFFQGGLTYAQVTIPFSAPVGTIDVRFVPIGQLCTATALSEGDGIVVGDAASTGDATTGASPVVTILRYGGNTGQSGDPGIPETVVGLPEELSNNYATCAANVCPRFRVVNAAAWTDSINFGDPDNGSQALPATVSDLLLASPIAPGQVPAQGSGAEPLSKADSSGYVGGINSGNASQAGMTLGVVAYPQPGPVSDTAVAIFQPSSVPDTQTLFVIGDPSNNVHPIQGLLVEDDSAAGTGSTDAGVDQQFLAKATLTTPATILIDTFDVRLYGLQAPYGSIRAPLIAQALAARQTDVICVGEVDYETDKANIVAMAANGNFPYAYWVTTNLQSVPSDSKGWYGTTPPLVTTAICAAEEDAGTLQALGTCATKCSSGSNDDPDAGITSIACLENDCVNQAVGFVKDPACLDCVAYYMVDGYSIDLMEKECGTDSHVPYGQYSWLGQNGSLLLSRYPFAKTDAGADDTEYFLFPGSSYRRIILRARLQLDSVNQMDVYCAQFVSPDTGNEINQYAGFYATPDAGLYPTELTADNGWRDEDNLQARDTIEWIKSQSTTRPAIVAGIWSSSPGYAPDGGAAILEPHDPEVFAQFTNAGFVVAHPANYTPDCSSCNTNPYNAGAPITTDGTIGFDFTAAFLYNFPNGSTLSDTFWNNTPAEWNVPVPDGGMFPLSMTYPQSVQILRP